jgi:nitrite reductase (cytochrome c-552)
METTDTNASAVSTMTQRPIEVQVRPAPAGGGLGRRAGYSVVFALVAAATAGVALLLGNINQRKQEGRQVALLLSDLNEKVSDPAEWGKSFPRQYDGYKRTVDIERTKYGGSEAFQRLDDDPMWRVIFNGYAFAIDYREERGHAYMLSDQRETERVKQKPQPGACLQCHASTVVPYREAGIKAGAPGTLEESATSENGWKQIIKGWETINPMKYTDASQLAKHPVACIDCHDPSTMALRVTKPAFLEGIRTLAASGEPTPHLPSIERWRKGDQKKPYDPNIDASRQEMRSMACGQCHVEYYFKGDEKRLTYPWHNGLKVEEIEAYYDRVGWSDWKHKESGAPVLKAQHPEFELWSQGIHARSGVSCADCHMPYKREGAIKLSDHQVRSPMLNTARACQTCHNYSESEIKARVETIQDRTRELMTRGEIATVDLINAIVAAQKSGASDGDLKLARDLQRKAQWRLDFIAAENSMGFHAPQESARILGEAIDFARQGVAEANKKLAPGKPVAAN